jgi:hypothetical protein
MGFLKGLAEVVNSTMSIPGAVIHDVVHAPTNIFVTKSDKSIIKSVAPKTTGAIIDAVDSGKSAVTDLLSGKLY